MKKFKPLLLAVLALASLLTACQQKKEATVRAVENTKAKLMLQGVWVDAETMEVNFMVKGDTIFYPDSTSQPAKLSVVGDSILIGEPPSSYPIVRLSDNVLVFKNQNGEELRLNKSNSIDDKLVFKKRQPVLAVVNHVLKRDSVVTFADERYHCYVTVNPTKFRVLSRSLNDDGVVVENVYYDNIIHISVYHGADKVFSSDMTKQNYAKKVPADFLNQSILGDIRFTHVDKEGFHFETIIGIPAATTSYVLDTIVSFDGKKSVRELK